MAKRIFDADRFRQQFSEANSLHKQANQSIKFDKDARRIAEQQDKSRPVFLRPSDISGDYDFSKVLITTLGGEAREIELEDLKAFQKNIQTLAAAYKGGITIPQIISLSRQADIDRANKEIHTAMPVSHKAGEVTFITNAGPNSDVSNHTVKIKFLAFSSVVLDIEKQTKTTIKNRLANGKVHIECDCGRFRFWYRYIATVGNFVNGRKEAGFPKEKNPELTGIACKHILRAVAVAKGPLGQSYLEKIVNQDRIKQHGRRYSESPADMVEMLDKQLQGIGKARQKIKPATARELKKLHDKVKSATERLEQNNAKIDEKRRRIARLEANFKAGLISKEDFNFYMGVERARKY